MVLRLVQFRAKDGTRQVAALGNDTNGQVVEGVKVADLKIGQDMELVLDTLLEDAETETIVWKWAPVGRAA